MIHEHVSQFESRLDGGFSEINPRLHEMSGCLSNVCIRDEYKLVANILIGHWHAVNLRV